MSHEHSLPPDQLMAALYLRLPPCAFGFFIGILHPGSVRDLHSPACAWPVASSSAFIGFPHAFPSPSQSAGVEGQPEYRLRTLTMPSMCRTRHHGAGDQRRGWIAEAAGRG